MKIILNGKETKIGKEYNITKLLNDGYGEVLDYVTVQVNDDIISKAFYDDYIINEGDVIEFLYYMGGGSGYFWWFLYNIINKIIRRLIIDYD